MTLRTSLQNAKAVLSNSSTPLLDAELILCHVLKIPKTQLITDPERKISTDQAQRFQQLIEERRAGKPIAYITHEKEFFGRSYFVDERVLIPRPETEEMVEDALKFLKKNSELKTVIDLGTGSGAIAITVAEESSKFGVRSSEFKVYGLEISEDALEVAEINYQRYPSKNLEFLKSDLLSQLPTSNIELPTMILANLPYIGTHSNRFISEETEKYEPHQALFGGSDGLELYRRTWKQVKEWKFNVAAMFMEIGFSQAEKMETEARAAFPEYHFEIKNDLAGLPRTAILISSPFHSTIL